MQTFPGRRGFSTISIVLICVTVLAVFAAVSMYRSSLGAASAGRSYAKHSANYAAEAGVRYAVRRLADTQKWQPQVDDVTRAKLTADGTILYSVRVLDNRDGLSAIVSPDGQTVEPGQAYVRSFGEIPGSNQGVHSNSQSLGAMATPGTPMFNFALLADQKLEVVNQSVVDGYNTAQVALSDPLFVQQYSPMPVWNGFLANGNLQTNESGQSVVVRDSSVFGQVAMRGGSPKLEGAYRIGASAPWFRREVPVHRPPYSPSAATTDVAVGPDEVKMIAPGAYRSISVKNRGILLLDMVAGGLNQFYVSEAVTIDGGAVMPIRLTGPDDALQLYVGKGLSLQSGWMNPFGRPSQMSVMFVGDGRPNSKSTLELRNSQAWMLASGANCQIKIQDHSHFFGAAKGHDILVEGQSSVHYDVALRDKNISGLSEWRYRIVSQSCPSIEQEILALNLPPASAPAWTPPANATSVAPVPPPNSIVNEIGAAPPTISGPLVGELVGGQPPDSIAPLIPVPGGFAPLPPGSNPNANQISSPFIPVVAASSGGTTSAGGSGTGGTTSSGTSGTSGSTSTVGTGTGGQSATGTSGGTTTAGTGGTTSTGTATGGTSTGGTSGGGPFNPDPPAGYDPQLGMSGEGYGPGFNQGVPCLYNFVYDDPMSGHYQYTPISP